jgi:hypothetical protein
VNFDAKMCFKRYHKWCSSSLRRCEARRHSAETSSTAFTTKASMNCGNGDTGIPRMMSPWCSLRDLRCCPDEYEFCLAGSETCHESNAGEAMRNCHPGTIPKESDACSYLTSPRSPVLCSARSGCPIVA